MLSDPGVSAFSARFEVYSCGEPIAETNTELEAWEVIDYLKDKFAGPFEIYDNYTGQWITELL